MANKREMRWILWAALLALVLGGRISGQEPKAAESWARLQFLLGSWTGVGSGQPGEGMGACSFEPGLGGKVILRRNRADYPPKPGERTGTSHEDLMVIYAKPGAQGLSAIYFDNEGHTIEYAVSFPEKGPSAVFETAAGSGPRFRLTYLGREDGMVALTFEIAPPGAPYKQYLSGLLKRTP